MRVFALGLLGITALVGCAGAPDAPPEASPPPPPPQGALAVDHGAWRSAYYVGYHRDRLPPEAVDFGALTHLVVGRFVPRPDGSIDASLDLDPASGPELARRLVDLARAHDRRVLLMVGGEGEHAAFAAAAAPARRGAFVRALVDTMKAYGADGLDLDWEPIGPADSDDFVALVRAVRVAAPEAILTVPAPWVPATEPRPEHAFAMIAPLVDQLNLMTYGMAGDWDGWQSWHSAALAGAGPRTPSSVDTTVAAYVEAGVEPAKLGLGVGLFGACWPAPIAGPERDLDAARSLAPEPLPLGDLPGVYDDPDARRWDEAAAVPYLSFTVPHGALGCSFVSYEDARSVGAKARFAAARGLGGLMIWTLGDGYAPAEGASLVGELAAAHEAALAER